LNVKKILIILVVLLLAASAASAPAATEGESKVLFDGRFGPSYDGVTHNGNARAGEYEYLKSSIGGDLYTEYDPLPHRFEIDTHFLNNKDYFGEMSYAFHDIVVVNVLTRALYHNLDHQGADPNDPSAFTSTFTDRNPGDQYAIENTMRRAFVRLKLPDFPLHFIAEATTVDRSGTMQQLFLREYAGGADRVAQSRDMDSRAREVRLGLNSHLGPLEAEYFHREKRFEASGENVLNETYPSFTVPHNTIPDLESSSDTVKVHTSYPGRVIAAVTYSQGDRKNKDSGVKADVQNTAGDLVLTPMGGFLVVLKYREYKTDTTNPATVTLSGVGATYNVRTPISSKRDVMSGLASYRLTKSMTIKGDYTIEVVERTMGSGTLNPLQILPAPSGTASDTWDVAHRTTKTTERLGLYYRAMSSLAVRADYRAVQVTNPAYADDPDRIDAATASATWTPGKGVVVLASYGGTQEKRKDLTAPLGGGSRKTNRDQALGSVTVPVGDRASVTASYLYYKNKTKETVTFADAGGTYTLEDGVPYGDTAEVASLAASVSPVDDVTVTADASRCTAKGRFRLSGTVPNSSDIDILSDMKIVEDIISAGVEWNMSKAMGSAFRYQYRHYDDKLNDAQDGRVHSALATLYVKW
jgi:hypothetical protein